MLLGSVRAILGGDITHLLGVTASLIALLFQGELEVPWGLLGSTGQGVGLSVEECLNSQISHQLGLASATTLGKERWSENQDSCLTLVHVRRVHAGGVDSFRG